MSARPDFSPSDEEITAAIAAGITIVELRDRRAIAAVPKLERDARVLEKAEQAECVKLLRAFGGVVYSLSQARASKQTPGLPDCFVFLPRPGMGCWFGCAFECKRPSGGVQSEAQREFQAHCESCGWRYVLGGVREARALLVELGLMDRDGNPVRHA